MTQREFRLLDFFNCNYGNETYGFVETDNLNLFFPFESKVSIPIESSYVLYKYLFGDKDDIQEELDRIPVTPDWQLLNDGCLILVWKM